MRRSISRLLLIAAVPLVTFACDGEDDDDMNPYCYSEDASGAVVDSVRPDTGYVCVASASVASPSASLDSVRPDTSLRVRFRTVRRADLH